MAKTEKEQREEQLAANVFFFVASAFRPVWPGRCIWALSVYRSRLAPWTRGESNHGKLSALRPLGHGRYRFATASAEQLAANVRPADLTQLLAKLEADFVTLEPSKDASEQQAADSAKDMKYLRERQLKLVDYPSVKISKALHNHTVFLTSMKQSM